MRGLRIGIFGAVAVATVVVILSFVPVWEARNNPSADGLQWVVAILVVPVYVVLVLPALLLALIGRRATLIIGAVLIALAYLGTIAIFWN